MPSRMLERSWVSPITALSFLVVATTGLLMLFHVSLPGIKGLHQWLGVAFAVAALLHIVLNWRPFVRCLKQRSAVVALGVALALSVAAVLVPGAGNHDRPSGDRHRSHSEGSAEPHSDRSR